MGRRKKKASGLGGGLIAIIVAIALIPKQVWITLIWLTVAGVIAWAAWRLYQANRQNHTRAEAPSPTAERTLAEIMADTPKSSFPPRTASRQARPFVSPPPPEPPKVLLQKPDASPPGPADSRLADQPARWHLERHNQAQANRDRAAALRHKHAQRDKSGDDEFLAAQVAPSPPIDTWSQQLDAMISVIRTRAQTLREKHPPSLASSPRASEPARASEPPQVLLQKADDASPPGPADSRLADQPARWRLERHNQAQANRDRAAALRHKHAQNQRRSPLPAGPAPAIEVAPSYRTRPDRPIADVSTPAPASADVSASAASILALRREADEPVAIARPTREEPEVAIPRPSVARWISFEESVSVQKREISRGGFYFGVSRGHAHERAFTLDPTFTTSWTTDWRGENVRPWDGYPDLATANRYAFIEFLNSDRRDPRFGIAFARLYLRGIEHRLLEELPGIHGGSEEAILLLHEVDALRQAYRQDYYFLRQCQALIEFAQVKLDLCELDFDPDPGHRDWPLPAQVMAARALQNQAGLPEDLAFAWAQTQVDELRSSTWNCVRPEIALRFRQLYNAAYPQGMVVKPGKSRLTLGYTRVGSYSDTIQLRTDLPDVTRSVAPIRPLVELLRQAATDLEALRKARRSKSRSPMRELAALPESLRGTWVPDELQELARTLDTRVQAETAPLVPVSMLTKAFALNEVVKLGKRDMTALILALESMGFAIEPDLRFHGHIPGLDSQVVIFALPKHAARSPSASYEASLLMIQAAVTLASNDAPMAPFELEAATHAIERQFRLPESERLRLEAHLRLLQHAPVPLSRLEGRSRQLSEHDREAFAHALLDIAASDGHIAPEEVRVIERLYKALGLDAARVPADLHHASVGTRRPRSGPRQNAGLDADVIEAKLAETARVQKVLSKIFTEAEDPQSAAPALSAPTAKPPLRAAASSIEGLDPDHTMLLAQVLAHASEEWPQSEFDALCQASGLIPGGALEMLNEAAFGVCGEALIEGDDPLYVNDYVKAELAAAMNH